jgi:predicted nucleic acid-binding protein
MTVAGHYVVDACGLIAYLRDEPGAEVMEDLMTDPQNILSMHAITLGEIYYDTRRMRDATVARQVLADIAMLPIVIVRDLSDDLLISAGEFKVSHRISYADAFVLALARKAGASVITTDHHEFDPIAQTGQVAFRWLR